MRSLKLRGITRRSAGTKNTPACRLLHHQKQPPALRYGGEQELRFRLAVDKRAKDNSPDQNVSNDELSDSSSNVYASETSDGYSSDQLLDEDGDDDPSPEQLCSQNETVTDTESQNMIPSAVDSTEPSRVEDISSYTQKNFCFICKKPQSKIARHLKKHEKEDPEIAEAFLLPKNSKERKRLLEKLRNKGNYEHNQEVARSVGGDFKLKRRPGSSSLPRDIKQYVHCTYCKGLLVRKDLWRHTKRCASKTSETEVGVKSKVLALADIAESTYSQTISIEVFKLLRKMRNDNIASVVRNDFLILQLAQSLYNKYEDDPTKFEHIRTKVREMGRLLLTLIEKYSIFSFEAAVYQGNFSKVVGAVKTVAGYDEETHSYSTPSLAQKLGHSLSKIGDIILCRAIATDDESLIKASEHFKKLCRKEWSGQVLPAALSKTKGDPSSTVPFPEDVELLHGFLDKNSTRHGSVQTYAELARVALAQTMEEGTFGEFKDNSEVGEDEQNDGHDYSSGHTPTGSGDKSIWGITQYHNRANNGFGYTFGREANQEMSTLQEPTTSYGLKESWTTPIVTSSNEMRSRTCIKRPWSEAEVSAVMKHFETHITNGDLASKGECETCKLAEGPVLSNRSLQNIRDFVRNRGLMAKRNVPI